MVITSPRVTTNSPMPICGNGGKVVIALVSPVTKKVGFEK
ncbi:hypothetical protein APA_3790 [Pseudanabaena sp. lw0831]|nr:hypothetical protein APA_3790 [Pseudanabaena sp. lw0831]